MKIDTVFDGEWEYMVGGGAATFDCSGDGFPELFLSGGAGPSALYQNRSPQGGALAFEKTDAVALFVRDPNAWKQKLEELRGAYR